MAPDALFSVAWPVVMMEGRDVVLFAERGDLQATLEPWIAYDEAVEFYDALGRRLRVFAAHEGVDVMLGEDLSRVQIDQVVQRLRESLNETERSAHVPVDALRMFIAGLEATPP